MFLRRDAFLILLIAAAGLFIRLYPAWNAVLSDEGTRFLETDSWYHVRLIENQVRNYPWRVTLDPYAAPGGQFVPIAPLFDTIVATAVLLVHGTDATAADVQRVAAFAPPALGALAIVVTALLAGVLFDRRAGLIAASLLAVLPGHFLDRTLLGFVDHHALEALLALTSMLMLTLGAARWSPPVGLGAGLSLGLYLLGWGSGAFLIAIVGVWLVLWALLARTGEELACAAKTTGIAAVLALALVIAIQDPRMHRYGSQVVGLGGLATIAAAAWFASGRARAYWRSTAVLASAATLAVIAALLIWLLAPGLAAQLGIDVARLLPDADRMAVLEARPLFLYAGEWRWTQPWAFFRTGIVIAAIAVVPFAVRVWRQPRAGDLLLLVYAIATGVATVGQNRFGYYLVPACALLGGWLAMELLDWGGVPHARNPAPMPRTRLPLAREVAVVAIAGGMFAPNLAPAVLLAERAATFPAHWRHAMTWLHAHTPAPFLQSAGAGDDYYYARYSRTAVPAPDYAVMNWWDQGYWMVQHARRVPVANPTQERAPNAAKFYATTDEADALALLAAERSRYVLSDWELPFRRLEDGTIMGRFQSVLDWAGGDHARYYEIVYRREGGGWTPVWIFHEPYYRSMAVRLSVYGGQAATPANTTSVLTLTDRVDVNGRTFRELLSEQTYATYEAARDAARTASGDVVIAGLDPWRSAFPVEPLTNVMEVHAVRTPDQQPGEAPWVRIFHVK